MQDCSVYLSQAYTIAYRRIRSLGSTDVCPRLKIKVK